MLALLSFFIAVIISLIIVRIGTVALEMTGLSRDVAAFQAQSAFFGAGFTTSESEYVVSHPMRRRIIRTLIFFGNAGITSIIVTLVLTLVGGDKNESTITFLFMVTGLLGIYLVFKSKRVEKIMRKIIKKFLQKRFPELHICDYTQLLGITRGYSISQIKVKEDNWLANKSLRELELNKEGILVLGIYRKVDKKEVYLNAPRGNTMILPGDILVCYGPESVLLNLSKTVNETK